MEKRPVGDLAGAVAVVTGASRGIGAAVAREFARQGANVVLGVRTAASAAPAVESIRSDRGSADYVLIDVDDLDGSRTALDNVVARCGRLDILVNNVGNGIKSPAIDVSPSDFETVVNRNVRSTYFLSQKAAQLMRESGGGAIVNVASQAGIVAIPNESVYGLSKAAIIHMTKSHALEWGGLGIRVNAVAPTFIETDGTALALSDPAFRADVIERIAALHRIGAPDEVAAAVCFLASSRASLITGVTLAVDGGWTIR